VVFNPTFNGIHAWDGTDFFPLEDLLTTSGGFVEDSQGRLWSLEEYGGLRYYNDNNNEWTNMPLTGWGNSIKIDPTLPGTIWAVTDYQLMRTDGINTFSRTIEDFPGSAAWFTGFAADQDGIAWIGTWSQFTITGSTLIRLDANTGEYQTWSYDEGWPFPGQHVRPMAITPDGLLWLQYDSEYPSTDAGLCWYDGVNVGTFPSSPGGIPQYGGLPNSTIKDLEVREIEGGYELWMSCLGRGIAVLDIITDPVGISDQTQTKPGSALSVFPNPASEKAAIGFNLDNTGFADLSVYDIHGRKIKALISRSLDKGRHNADWDLTDQGGNRIEQGVYIVRLLNSENIRSAKIIVR
jgi:hypothetical protein